MDWKDYNEHLLSFNIVPPRLLPDRFSPRAVRKEHYDLHLYTRDGLTDSERKLLVFGYKRFLSCFCAYRLAIGDPIENAPVADESLTQGGPPVSEKDREDLRRWMTGGNLAKKRIDDFSVWIYKYEAWAEALCEIAEKQLLALSIRLSIEDSR